MIKNKKIKLSMVLFFIINIILFPTNVQAQPNGIDISSYQGDIDFNAIKSSDINYTIIKASEGITYTDFYYKIYYNNAKNAGLKVSFYHFMHPANNPIAEAQHFLSTIQGLKLDCKVAIDIEITQGLDRDTISDHVRQFAEYLKANNVDFCIYTYSSFYDDYLNDSVKGYAIWIANYSHDVNVTNKIGWQSSESSYISGILGQCDTDEFSIGIEIGNNNTVPFVTNNYTPVNNVHISNYNQSVATLQANLKRLLQWNIAVDGTQGNQTTTATKQFQKMVNITQDGIAGNQTQGIINQILAKPTLKVGSNGVVVRFLQYRLGITSDGVFGNNTKQAIINYQRNHGLVADGVVGSKTWSILIGN